MYFAPTDVFIKTDLNAGLKYKIENTAMGNQ
jgi:hypothetical protein